MRGVDAELRRAHRVVEPDGQAAGAVRRAGGQGGRRGARRHAGPGGAALAAPARHAADPEVGDPVAAAREPRPRRLRAHRRRGGCDHGARPGRTAGCSAATPTATRSSDRLATAPTTPYLRVDLDRLRRNVRSTAEWATTHRLALRPHVKTHKSPEIARLQLGQGAVGLTVATLGEAEVFSQHGCTDLFVAYPLCVDERAAERLRGLAERGRVAIGVDSVEGAARAGRLLAPYGVEVVVEVDCGQHRTGCPPEEAGSVARRGRPGRAHGARGVHLPGAQLRPGRDGDRGGGRGPSPGHRTRGRRARGTRGVRGQRRLDTELRPSRHGCPHRGAARASTSSATPSSGSSAACPRSPSR